MVARKRSQQNDKSEKPLKILFVATEVSPFSKTGGLGDVAGSLPKALRQRGVDIRVALPKYGTIQPAHLEKARVAAEFTVALDWRAHNVRVHALDAYGDGDSIYFIENDFYFNREWYYGYGDDYERLAHFTKASIEMLVHLDFRPDVLHFNDWHTALGPTYLRDLYGGFKFYKEMKSLMTIHNLHYQGVFGRDALWAVGLNDGYFVNGDYEFFGNISFLKGGLMHSDAISTVSKTYIEEIKTPAYGYGMDGVLRDREAAGIGLYGITNGIDAQENDPATDARIFANYDAGSIEKKKENKRGLQNALGLPETGAPMLAMITRLVEQKGFDILTIIMDELMGMDVQLVVLGTGEGRYENMLKHYAHYLPHKVSANMKFDTTLAQRIYAGADIFLMPSVYEPCGLGQLFAMRYGTIPIVRRTGGLADTVKHFDRETGAGNGFVFEDFVASGLMWAIREAVGAYAQPEVWGRIVRNAMEGHFSWLDAADEYIAMYREIKGGGKK